MIFLAVGYLMTSIIVALSLGMGTGSSFFYIGFVLFDSPELLVLLVLFEPLV